MSQDYTWPRLRSTSSIVFTRLSRQLLKAVLFKAPQDNRNTGTAPIMNNRLYVLFIFIYILIEIMFTIVEQLLLFVCCVSHVVHVSAQNASKSRTKEKQFVSLPHKGHANIKGTCRCCRYCVPVSAMQSPGARGGPLTAGVGTQTSTRTMKKIDKYTLL